MPLTLVHAGIPRPRLKIGTVKGLYGRSRQTLRWKSVHATPRLALTVVLIAGSCLIAEAKTPKKAGTKAKNSAAEREAATRLQVFLDRANFGPGKLDGHYGEFTREALALYRQAHGESPAPADPSKNSSAPPDVEGLDLKSVDPVFITYTVTDADLLTVGALPDDVAAKARLKTLPYRAAAEAIAEKFHSDKDFLEQLNPGKTKAIKAGDQLIVPNVEPFDLTTVKDLRAGSEMAPAATAANDMGDDTTEPAPDKTTPTPAAETDPKAQPAAGGDVTIQIDGATKMLSVYQGSEVIAAYPVSIGSEETRSPLGDWKVRGVATMPTFRYDKKVLEKGERGKDFKMLPPGPNNPVGVVWIALNKKAIGIHGTDDPDSIGRNASHGCVRMANWDIVRLAAKVKTGVPVSIH